MRAFAGLLIALLPSTAFAQARQGANNPAPVAVAAVAHDARGHTMVTLTNGQTVDDGIANTRGNIALAPLGLSGVQAMPLGSHYGWVAGTTTIPALTVELPPSPQPNDVARVGSTVTITALTVEDASGNVLTTPTMTMPVRLAPLTQIAFAYTGTGWTPLQIPVAPYTDAQAAAAAPVQSIAGLIGAPTAAQIEAALSLGTAAYQSSGSFYPASNPASYITAAGAPVQSVDARTGAVTLGASDITSALGYTPIQASGAPVQSVAGLTGAPTVAQVQTALGLGSAAYQPSTAFYGAANPAGYQTASQAAADAPVQSVNGATGAVAVATVPFYTAAGQVTGTKCWRGSATTVTGGTWSISYASAGFTAAPTVQTQAISASALLAGLYFSTMTAPSATAVAGAVDLAGVGGLGPAGVVVQVLACGT